MIRRRAVVGLAVLFAAVILVLAFEGIESSRKNMLNLLRQEGESLMQSLITSARNNLAASIIVEEAANERLIDVSALLSRLVGQDRRDLDSLEEWERVYRLERIDIINADHHIIASSWPETVGRLLDADSDAFAVVDSVGMGKRSVAVAPPLPSALPQDDDVSLACRTTRGIMLVRAKAKKITDYQESLGIGYVLRQMGAQEGVDYVVLQSDEGIVLASRNIGHMMAINADPFLTDALSSEEVSSRVHEFEGKEILEVVQPFKSDVMPSGIFRLGLSMDAYDKLYANSLKQLAILSIVLFILGVVGSYAATSTKKLAATTGTLEQLRSLTDEIIQSLEAAVVATDRDGRVTVFNPQAEEILGIPAKAVAGRKYGELIHDDLLSLDKIRHDSAQVIRGETTYRRQNGDRLHLLVSTSPIFSGDGAYSGSVALVYDVTEVRRLEENARAAARLSELGTLAAGIAHEIRNPLNSISIAAQRLRQEFSPQENEVEYQSFLKTISAEIDRLNKIVQDFLALARGNMVEKVLVDLREYLEDILSLAKLEIAKNNAVIHIRVGSGINVSLDKQEMKKVFLNLISNATQAMGQKGEITISAEKTERGKVTIDVINTGEPIPAEIRHRMFQPYFTTRSDGTGLGLAICQRIVADHGGTIELCEGEPTTFRITI